MGRSKFSGPLLPGSELSVGGKDIEVDTMISREDFLAGRPFLNASAPKAVPKLPERTILQPHSMKVIKLEKLERKEAKPVERKPSVEMGANGRPIAKSKVKAQALNEEGKKDNVNTTTSTSKAMANVFKTPLLSSTVIPQTNSAGPTPRHDPFQPNALVFKRPDKAPKGKQIVDVVLDPLLGKHLREHQREGVKFLYECVMGMRDYDGQGAILADDMGLGKTLQTIALLWTLLKQNPIYDAAPVVRKAVVVCPVGLANNWRQEFNKWLGNDRIGVFVYDDKKKRVKDFTHGRSYSVMIIGYEMLRSVQTQLQKGSGVDIVIADEGHRMKTVQNKAAQAIVSLNTARRIVLSGTTIQNDLSEFFSVVELVNPGVLGTSKTFMKEFEGPIVKSRQPEATKKDIEKGEARGEELASITSLFILRREASILAKYLPAKTEYVLFCRPTPSQASVYRHVLASPEFQTGLGLGGSESSLQLITALKKICNSPSLLDPRNLTEGKAENLLIKNLHASLPANLRTNNASSGKLRVLDQLLHVLNSKTDEKIVLVSNYTSTLTILAQLLTSLSLPFLRLDGSVPSAKRQELVNTFNRTPSSKYFAFLLSARAGGVGLNLIGASRIVLFDVDWNPATDAQAMARIHRDGQTRECKIYRLLLKGSLEEKIWQRQVTKIGLADSIMAQKGGGTAQFSKDELRDLFKLDESPDCQTHALLGCDCGGRGGKPSSGIDTPLELSDDTAAADEAAISGEGGEDSKENDTHNGSDNDSDSSSLPSIPELIKATPSNIAAQQLKETRRLEAARQKRLQKNKNKNKNKGKGGEMDSLMAYEHIDTLSLREGGGAVVKETADGSGECGTMDGIIDDEVLLGVLKDEDTPFVDFMFKKRREGGGLGLGK